MYQYAAQDETRGLLVKQFEFRSYHSPKPNRPRQYSRRVSINLYFTDSRSPDSICNCISSCANPLKRPSLVCRNDCTTYPDILDPPIMSTLSNIHSWYQKIPYSLKFNKFWQFHLVLEYTISIVKHRKH